MMERYVHKQALHRKNISPRSFQRDGRSKVTPACFIHAVSVEHEVYWHDEDFPRRTTTARFPSRELNNS